LGSDSAKSTYQVLDRPVILTGARYDDIDVDMTVSDVHASVAWEVIVQGQDPTRGIALDDFLPEPRADTLAHKLFAAKALVHEKYVLCIRSRLFPTALTAFSRIFALE
jgi:hypothetical protein